MQGRAPPCTCFWKKTGFVTFFLRELTQEQERLDLLTYSEELTFEWKGKQVIYSHTWEVALLFCYHLV